MMDIKQAQEIIEKEGFAWIVLAAEKISDITILITCRWNGEIRYVSYSIAYNTIIKIM